MVSNLQETECDLPAHIFLVRLEDGGLEKLVGAARDIVLGLKIFIYSFQLTARTWTACARSYFCNSW